MKFSRLALVLLVASGCHSGTQRMGGDVDLDVSLDRTDARWDLPADVLEAADGEDEDGPCHVAPPCPEGPADGIMGAPCLTDMDCREFRDAFCMSEDVDVFEGEYYISNLGGACGFWRDFAAGCEPDVEGSCPEGAACLVIGSEDWSGCLDVCTPADTSWELYGWACGCRRGYQCDLRLRMCFSGCSNDRQCCETWEDEDDDTLRDAEEVTRWEGCTSFCDGDDPEEFEDCKASFTCINPGTEGAMIGDPCEHDSHCPSDGTCYNFKDWETGEEYVPGGYCVREGCNFVGRGCEDAGGACLMTGSLSRWFGTCFKPCHVGRDLSDPDYECRTTPGEEQVCYPVSRFGWIGGAPEGGEDGYCFPGNFSDGTGEVGAECEFDEDCASPLGLGDCQYWFGDVPFCTIWCNEELVETESICGHVDSGEPAGTVCAWSMCMEACDRPSEPPGANGCSRPDFACLPLSRIGTTYVPEGALRLPGVCLPACTTDTYCEETFGEESRCETYTGICSET